MSLRAKATPVLIMIACFAFTIWAFAFKAQKNDTKNSSVTVTGCLKQGDESGEFSLIGDDGKLYELKSSSVKLSDHVGHKVTVTGSFKAESYEKTDKDEAKESKESGKKEAGDIQVGNLKMVSSSCQ